MLVVMQSGAAPADIDAVCEAIKAMGFTPLPLPGAQRTTVGLIGNDGQVDGSHISGMAGVAQVLYVSQPFKQVSREWKADNTVVEIAPGVRFGGREVPVIAGPCSVESEAQLLAAARAAKARAASVMIGVRAGSGARSRSCHGARVRAQIVIFTTPSCGRVAPQKGLRMLPSGSGPMKKVPATL